MDAQKVQKLLAGMAAINVILAQETAGDGYFSAIVDRFSTVLKMAGTGLQWSLDGVDPDDTEELNPVTVENASDTQEIAAVGDEELEAWEHAK